jgi:hypothetical protein
MARQLHGLCRHVAEISNGNVGSLVLCLDSALGILPAGSMAATPLGLKNAAYFEEIAESDGDELLDHCSSWYSWWDKEINGSFWFKTGLALLWQRVPWRIPQSDREKRAVALARLCFDRAAALEVIPRSFRSQRSKN